MNLMTSSIADAFKHVVGQAFADICDDVPPNACETASGRYVDVVNPDPSTISIEDIGWSLSRQGRFAGHTLSQVVWSVGQHSLFVEDILGLVLDPEDNGYRLKPSLIGWLSKKPHLLEDYCFGSYNSNRVLIGSLLHDGTEAYLVDLPSPVKRHKALREPYKELEKQLKLTINLALKLDEMNELEEELILWADLLALRIEAANLMPSRGRGWTSSTNELPVMELNDIWRFPKPLPWDQVYESFMSRYRTLREQAA